MVSLAHKENTYRDMASAWLAARGFALADVQLGRDAWSVAHGAGICRDAYEDRNVCDAHIKTVLARIMPNAVFKDTYRY